jgi:uncharacterized protein YdhG (YjbR/CyaY superfamily)
MLKTKKQLTNLNGYKNQEINMASSKASTVEEYLQELPEERRQVIAEVRQEILMNLPSGYQEVMNWGMIAYEVPLKRYPDTYNKQPLMYAALAAQKNHYAVYMSSIYQDQEKLTNLQDEFAKRGKKLDMGKSCVRFKKLENLPLDVIGTAIANTSVEEFIDSYEKSREMK